MKHSYLIWTLIVTWLTAMPTSAWGFVDDEPTDPPTDTSQGEPTPEPDALYIDGTDIIANPDALTSLECVKAGNITYDTENKALTLTDVTLSASAEYIIDSKINGLTIQLVGASIIESGCLRLYDTAIKGSDGSSLIATGTCYILARGHNLSISTTYLSLSAGNQVGIDNRDGRLTVNDADVIILNGNHEFGHNFVNINFFNENARIIIATPRKNSLEIPEGGTYIDYALYGRVLKFINLKQALYLMNEANYDKTFLEFQKGFNNIQDEDLKLKGEFSTIFENINYKEMDSKDNKNIYIGTKLFQDEEVKIECVIKHDVVGRVIPEKMYEKIYQNNNEFN